jgi:hypothetical protein
MELLSGIIVAVVPQDRLLVVSGPRSLIMLSERRERFIAPSSSR